VGGRSVPRGEAAEGAAAKTLEWYGVILHRAIRGLGEDCPIDQFAGPELRAWILEDALDVEIEFADGHGRRLLPLAR
jgi:hypothetical protein